MSIRIIAVMMVALVVGTLGTSGYANAAEKKLIKFSVEDRKGKTRTEKEFKGKSFILVASDKAGSKYTDAWMRKIQVSLEEKKDAKPAVVMAIADLSEVPRLMRGAVRKILPKPDKVNLILDWEGVFDKAYGFKASKANLVVFSNSGDVIFHEAVMKLDIKKAKSIVELLVAEQKAKSEKK